MKPNLGIPLAALLLAASHTDGAAQTSSVTNCTEAALRAALDTGGTVTFACDGTITLVQTITNALDTVLDATGHQVIISGGNAVGVFHLLTNVHLTLVNLTVAGGHDYFGAGIYNDGGWLTLDQCRFATNTASPINSFYDEGSPTGGGAVYNAGTLAANACVFSSNSAQGGGGALGGTSTSYRINSGPGGPGSGGAVYNAGAATLTGCRFTSNSAEGGMGGFGGGGFTWAVSSSPGGAGSGGAVFNAGTATITGCTFDSNAANGGEGGSGGNGFIGPTGQTSLPTPGAAAADGSGGAIFNSGDLTLVNNTCTNNTASGGQGGDGGSGGTGILGYVSQDGSDAGPAGSGWGGALCSLGTARIAGSTFVGNTAAGGLGGPGGFGSFGGDASSGGSGYGGGVYDSGVATLINCTLTANLSAGGTGGAGGVGAFADGGDGGDGGSAVGGGIDGPCSLTNCTLVSNSAIPGIGGAGGTGEPQYQGPPYGRSPNGYAGGGGSASNGSTFGTAAVNTLLAANSPADTNVAGSIDSNYNLYASNTPGVVGPLADNGGPTLTMALVPGSPAIDSADTALAPPTDQRGFPRPFGAAADIGAVEYGSWPILDLSLPGAGSLMTLFVQGTAGQPCRLLTSTTLSNWIPLATNTIPSSGALSFQLQPASDPQRFYRIVSP